MFTIRIKTKSTKLFSWNSTGSWDFDERTAPGLHEAVSAAIKDFHDHVRCKRSQEGLHACLVTWEDGDDFYAYLFAKGAEIPAQIPWILMRSKPERVTRAAD